MVEEHGQLTGGSLLLYQQTIISGCVGIGAWNYVLLVSILACGDTKPSSFIAAPVLPLANIPSEVMRLLGSGRWHKGPVSRSAVSVRACQLAQISRRCQLKSHPYGPGV